MNEQVGKSPEDDVGFIAARHSIKPKKGEPGSEEYPGISEEGIELARESAASWVDYLKNTEPGTVLFMAGASDQIRTKSTMEAITAGIKEQVAAQGLDVPVYDRQDIIARGTGVSERIKSLTGELQSQSERTAVVSFPMFLSNLGVGGEDKFLEKDGTLTPYSKDLMARNENNDQRCVASWIQEQGRHEDLVGPNPTEIATDQLKGVQRLWEFARRQLPGRRIVIGAVGHSWTLDALATFVANNGQVTPEGFQKIGGQMIKETQPMRLEMDAHGAKFYYADQEFDVPLEGEEEGEGQKE